MKRLLPAVFLVFLPSYDAADRPAPEPNPAIDMEGHLRDAAAAAAHRKKRLLNEADFIRMSGEAGTVVLDARSKEKFDLHHIQGAVHLNYSDITVESLKRLLPDKDTRILIYCNNNFVNAEEAYPEKRKVASLNLSTYVTLYSYGYHNVYELGPRIDPKKSKLTFEGTTVTK